MPAKRKDVTLYEYINMIEKRRRHCFKRNVIGAGCLHFVRTLVSDMAVEKVVSKKSEDYKDLMGIPGNLVKDQYIIPGYDGTFF